jgi:RNase adaptor protein for sRNA GlmZ degradation
MMRINIQSFSYVKGRTVNYDNGGGFVFDCRGLRNPVTETDLAELTGQDPEVIEFFGNDEEAVAFAGDCTNIVRNSLPMLRRKGVLELNIAFGCVGGKHRSVWCANRVASMLSAMPGVSVTVNHSELGR